MCMDEMIYNIIVVSLNVLLFKNTILAVDESTENVHYPVVLWNGLGGSCCEGDFGLEDDVFEIFHNQPEIKYIRSIKIGANEYTESFNSCSMDVTSQVKMACRALKSDNNLISGYNAIGYSQGGLFLRALAEVCPEPPMKKLISLGAPQMGTFGIPGCDELGPKWSKWCHRLDRWAKYQGFYKFTRSFIVPMEYWNSPYSRHASAKSKNSFLKRINNEGRQNNTAYKENLSKLELLVLVMYDEDEMVQPKESSWFGTYAPETTEKVLNMEETELYKKDKIGLKKLNESGKIHFIKIDDASHLAHGSRWFINNIIKQYL